MGLHRDSIFAYEFVILRVCVCVWGFQELWLQSLVGKFCRVVGCWHEMMCWVVGLVLNGVA